MAFNAESSPVPCISSIEALLAFLPDKCISVGLTSSSSIVPIMASVLANRGSFFACSSFALSCRCIASFASFSRFIFSSCFFSLVFFSAFPTRASSNSDKSFFLPPFFFDAAPNLDFTTFPDPLLASSSARRAAFSRFLRAASSALAAAASALEAPRKFAPSLQFFAAAASACRACSASLTAWFAAFFSLAATAFWLGPPRGMII
mmetsp:Transcript_18522/g.30332  ORF Transcript_18522/g.30332 Transcript_18522/m.30332 type:complete len:205 (+) Transcript_18522:1731-2345(+)